MATKPNCWDECPSIGSITNFFVPFKVPLDSTKFNIAEENTFSLETVFEAHRNLGLIVNLTNSEAYYDFNFQREYKMIKCEGHKTPPTFLQVDMFIRCVDTFRKEHPDDLVGVHCTHGFNRTGFMIVSYLVSALKYDLETALNVFARNRSPGIYKQSYVDELVKRHGDPGNPPFAAVRPWWHVDEIDLLVRGEIPGVSKVTDAGRAKQIYRRVREMARNSMTRIEYDLTQFDKINDEEFIGEDPVSMTSTNALKLKEEKYMVSWNVEDAVRFLMVVFGNGEVYMLDRKCSVYCVENIFSDRVPFLVDGEMVEEESEGRMRLRYLICDIIEYRLLRPEDLTKFHARKAWMDIIETIAKKGLLDKNAEPFSVALKQFWPLGHAAKIWSENFRSQLNHNIDGLIFQPANRPYCFGRSYEKLLWKPRHTVDFRLIISTEKPLGMLSTRKANLYVLHHNREKCYMPIKFDESMAVYNNQIVECLRGANGEWTIHRVREDKNLPNSWFTVIGVMESIFSPVDEEFLIEFIWLHGYPNPKR